MLLLLSSLALLTMSSPFVAAQDPEPDFFLGGFYFIICMVGLVVFVIWVLLAIWVYKDANSRGMNGTLWAILFIALALVFGIIGAIAILIIYLVMRQSHHPYVGPMPGYPPYQQPPPGYGPGPYGPPPPPTYGPYYGPPQQPPPRQPPYY